MLLPKNLYGIIGWPLAQTLSPLLHNNAFKMLQMPSAYFAWPVMPENLETFFKSLRILNIKGLSVTIPHKISVMPYLDSILKPAELAGAVNTVFWQDNNLCGENTDVAGFLAPLEKLAKKLSSALVLGAGGAACAVCSALTILGLKNVVITSHNDKKQFELAEKFGFIPILWNKRYEFMPDIVINTTPLGMKGKYINETPYDFKKIEKPGNETIAYDLVYNPLMTKFLESAKHGGRKIITGAEMFFCQANAQFELWTGASFPSEIRKILDNALEEK